MIITEEQYLIIKQKMKKSKLTITQQMLKDSLFEYLRHVNQHGDVRLTEKVSELYRLVKVVEKERKMR